ncbi:hypothetical protein, partial [Salmonella enterica]|uniref:hypothetical protein n=1 Tax=Salmonella enterica TaxID=28901 RepID=UPI00398221C5
MAGGNMHPGIYDIWGEEGKKNFFMIDKNRTHKKPFFFSLKSRTEAMLGKKKIFSERKRGGEGKSGDFGGGRI